MLGECEQHKIRAPGHVLDGFRSKHAHALENMPLNSNKLKHAKHN